MTKNSTRPRHLWPAYTLIAMLFPSLALAGPGAAPGAANQLSKDACRSLIELDAAPYRREVHVVWVEDRLFMYVEVLKLLSSMLDQDPQARTAIEKFRRGQGSADDLQRVLRAKADQTVSYADSLARKHNAPFYWHYPVVHVEDGNPRRVSVTLPIGVGSRELRMDLGPDSRTENARALASAKSLLDDRITIRMTPSGTLAPLNYVSEKDYLMRHDHVPASCFEPGSASEALALAPPSDNGQPAVSERTSSGRPEGAVVMGFPVSDYAGPRGGSGAAVSSPGGSGGAVSNPGSSSSSDAGASSGSGGGGGAPAGEGGGSASGAPGGDSSGSAASHATGGSGGSAPPVSGGTTAGTPGSASAPIPGTPGGPFNPPTGN